jgi:hypothetical protein
MEGNGVNGRWALSKNVAGGGEIIESKLDHVDIKKYQLGVITFLANLLLVLLLVSINIFGNFV